MEVVPFGRRSYSAKVFTVRNCDLVVTMSGTLDGYVDFCVQESNGKHLTYTLDPAGLRLLANAAIGCADDITQNCLYDRDPLLEKE